MAIKRTRSKRKGNADKIDSFLCLFEIEGLIRDHPDRLPSSSELFLLNENGFSYEYFRDNYELFKKVYDESGGVSKQEFDKQHEDLLKLLENLRK